MTPEIANYIVTNFPNFLFAFILAAIMWQIVKRMMDTQDRLTDALIDLCQPCQSADDDENRNRNRN